MLITFAATGVVMRINFADELVFALLVAWVILIWASKSTCLNKVVLYQFILFCIVFVIAMLVAVINEIPFIVSSMGFWQLWRAHISIMIGLLLLAYGKKIPSWPITKVLQFNMVFSLLQPFLGEDVMTALYPAGLMEYRSGILRSVGVFGNPNTNATFLALYLLFLWGSLLKSTKKRGKVILFVSFLALFSTGSRTAILVVPLLMVYMAWSIRRTTSKIDRKPGVSFTTYLVGLLFLVGIGVFLSTQEKNSTSMGYSLIPDISVISNTTNLGEGYFRTIATTMALGHFVEHPVVGLGYGTYGTPASFSWPSPYLVSDDLIIEEDTRGLKLSQLDVLMPVILAESGLLGFFVWCWSLMKLVSRFRIYSAYDFTIFNSWVMALLIATFSGPGITHPIVVVLIPFVMNWLTNIKPTVR